MSTAIIGIDTSAYTSSICAIDVDSYEIIYEQRKVIEVATGKAGLRQNMAVFQHLKNMPYFINECIDAVRLAGYEIIAVGASDRPRDQKNSYMPVFSVGVNFASVIAKSLNVPLYYCSHQAGHIAAGMACAKELYNEEQFVAIHLSGGTTEVCLVNYNIDNVFEVQLLGGSLDLHCGQFVDRVGVALGLDFPSGKHLQDLASKAEKIITIPSYVNGFNVSFSGPTTHALRLIENEANTYADIARSVEHCILKTLEKLLGNISNNDSNINNVLIVGGVASNLYLRTNLQMRLNNKKIKQQIHYSEIKWSSDNAFGVAIITANKYKNRERDMSV